MSQPPTLPNDDPAALTSAEAMQLDRAIRLLPQPERRLLILSRLRGMNHRDIAQQTGLSEIEVMATLLRALTRISGKLRQPD